MNTLKIGVHLPSLRLPLKEALLTAAELGASGVEIDLRRQLPLEELSQTAVRQLRKMLDELGLRVAAVSFPTRHGYNVPEELDKRVEATKGAMRAAWSLGCSVVVNHVGRIPPPAAPPPVTGAESKPRQPRRSSILLPGADDVLLAGDASGASTKEPSAAGDEREWELLVSVLSDLGRYAAHVGATLAARTGSESPDDMARLIAALPERAMGVDLDPGSLIANGYAPLEMVEKVGASILHVHARDGVRDRALLRGEEVALGRGQVDFPALVGALDERGYRGYFTVQREFAEDAVFELRQGVQYLRNLA
ncbi:MAG: sugar phosphate isomerase/epimerase [Planctomycetia bacterium]|nr:sugar phosphate isomerase/epimerase [Planctomycetia bacterium]